MRHIALATLAAATLAASAPAFAQTVEELTVTGRYGAEPRSLSTIVHIGDLNLTLASDRNELRKRVSTAANDLCDRLGEPRTSSGVVPACRDAATRDALGRVKVALAEGAVTPAEAYAAEASGVR